MCECREFHRKKLARRLLNTGQVEQQEQTFLQRLKQQCGAQFTQKMEGMNNDLATARDKQSEFEKWMQRQVLFFSLFSFSVFSCLFLHSVSLYLSLSFPLWNHMSICVQSKAHAY